MKDSCSSRYLNRLLGLFVLALVSGFGLSDWWIVLAQCDPCPTTDPSYVLFEKDSTVYVDLDTRFTQDERDAVIAGFQSMNFANAYQNNSGVFYDTSTPPSGRPPSYNQINVAWGVLYNNDGTINYNSASRINPGPNQPGHQQATIVINTEARLGSVATGAPFFRILGAIPS